MIAQNTLVVSSSPSALAPYDSQAQAKFNEMAKEAIKKSAFADHWATGGHGKRPLTQSSIEGYRRALCLFAEAMAATGARIDPDALMTDPAAWRGMGVGQIEYFRRWLLKGGRYSPASVAKYLNNIRKLAKVAQKAGAIPPGENFSLIDGVPTIDDTKEARAEEAQRRAQSGNGQKLTWNLLEKSDYDALFAALPLTPQGLRDAVLLGILRWHGPRVSELVSLRWSDIDFDANTIRFYRQKTRSENVVEIKRELRPLLLAYRQTQPDHEDDFVLSASKKGGELLPQAMTKRSVQWRVKQMGERVLGIDNLGPHDMRHSLAKAWADQGKTAIQANTWFGWRPGSSMFARYATGDLVNTHGNDIVI